MNLGVDEKFGFVDLEKFDFVKGKYFGQKP